MSSSGPHRRSSASSGRNATYEQQQPLIATSSSSSAVPRHEEVFIGQPSSSSSSLGRPWDCPRCTFINEEEILRCAMCQGPRFVCESFRHPVLLATVTAAEPSSSGGGGGGGGGEGSSGLGRRRGDSDQAGDEREEEGGGFLQAVPGLSQGQSILNGALSGALTGVCAFVGACAGAVAGALAGRAADSGVFRSAGLGAVAGAVVSMEALEATRSIWRSSRTSGSSRPSLASRVEYYFGGMVQDPFSGEDLVGPGGRLWQVDVDDMTYDELYEMFGPGRATSVGLSAASLARLPCHEVTVEKRDDSSGQPTGCTICLQDMVKGEMVRMLPNCGHTFHKECVDKWLSQHGICPVCRDEIVV